MTRYVIPWDALPARLPIQTTATSYLLLEHFDAPGWVYGVVVTLLAFLWAIAIVRMIACKAKPLPGYGS